MPLTHRSLCRSAVVVGLLALTLTTALPVDRSSTSLYDTDPNSYTSLTDDGERIPFETISRPITIQVDVRPTEEQEVEEAPSPALGVIDLEEEEPDSHENLLVDRYVEVLGSDSSSSQDPQRFQEQKPSVEEMLQWPYVNLDQFESRSDEQQDEYEA